MMNNSAGHGNIAVFVPHAGCPHRCSFCDQRAISGALHFPSIDEVRQACAAGIAANRGRTLELAFFGGSFTAIDCGRMEELLEAVQPFLGQGISGIRISTRPDAIDPERLEILKRFGVTAIELGAQSADDKVLLKNKRGHTAREIGAACLLIRSYGFELGLQMMLGLPGADESSDLASAAALSALAPDTVRIYPALVLKNTEMAQWFAAGSYRPLTLDEGVGRAARVMELFEESDIRIIRVGLHPTGELEQNLLAGPYHPAFRELCEGERMQKKLLAQLEAAHPAPGEIAVAVHPRDVSRMIGQNRRNAQRLLELGWRLRPVPSPEAAPLNPTLLGADELFLNEDQKEAPSCG